MMKHMCHHRRGITHANPNSTMAEGAGTVLVTSVPPRLVALQPFPFFGACRMAIAVCNANGGGSVIALPFQGLYPSLDPSRQQSAA